MLVGRDFWSRTIDFNYLVDEGYIAPADVGLFTCVDDAEEIMAALERFHEGPAPDAAAL